MLNLKNICIPLLLSTTLLLQGCAGLIIGAGKGCSSNDLRLGRPRVQRLRKFHLGTHILGMDLPLLELVRGPLKLRLLQICLVYIQCMDTFTCFHPYIHAYKHVWPSSFSIT